GGRHHARGRRDLVSAAVGRGGLPDRPGQARPPRLTSVAEVMSTPWPAENILMPIGLIVVGALAVVAALVAAAVLMRPSKARFSFENRDDHIVLELEGRLAYDEFALITMSALREAVRLKLGTDYKRLMIDTRKLTIVDDSAFWILIGGLGPALLTDEVKSAVICG